MVLCLTAAGPGSERALENVKDPELRAVIKKYCSAPPHHVAFQSSPATGDKVTHFDPWVSAKKLPTEPPVLRRRVIATAVEDSTDANGVGDGAGNGDGDGKVDGDGSDDEEGGVGDGVGDSTVAVAGDSAVTVARTWEARYAEDLVALPLGDGGSWDETILQASKFKVHRLRWVFAKCTGIDPDDVPKHNSKTKEKRSEYRKRMIAAILDSQSQGTCPSRKEEFLAHQLALRKSRKCEVRQLHPHLGSSRVGFIDRGASPCADQCLQSVVAPNRDTACPPRPACCGAGGARCADAGWFAGTTATTAGTLGACCWLRHAVTTRKTGRDASSRCVCERTTGC